MPLLFCYGSNHPKQLEDRVGSPKAIYAAVAPDYKRVFRGWSSSWNGGVASLVPSKRRPAYGYVAEVTQNQIRQMDLYEGVSRGVYYRKEIPVIVYQDGKQKKTTAIAYLSKMEEYNPPSNAYLEAIVKTIGTFWEIDGVGDIKIE